MESLLIHRCTIQTRSPTPNAFDENVFTWADTYTNVICRFSSPKGSMKKLPTGEFVEDMPKLFLKSTQEITEINRVVGTSGFEDTYEVLKAKKSYDGAGVHHIECDLKKVI